jgi:hypothetical protein
MLSSDPSPTHAPPNHKSWIRPWLFHMSIQWLYTTQWLVTKWTNKPNKDPVVTFFNILGTRHSDFLLFKFLLHFDFCPAELISGFWVVMVFNTTFINILVVVSFIGGENRSTRRKPPICHNSNVITQCCIEYTSLWTGFEFTTLIMICTDCIGSCKSNYHTITTTTTPLSSWVNYQFTLCE